MLPLAARASRCLAADPALLRALPTLGLEWGPDSQRRSLHVGPGLPGGAGGPASGAVDGAAAAGPAQAPWLDAFSPVEHLGGGGFDPIVFGTSIWEVMHSATGLPWWASIPATTLAVRAALLPLTLKARAATVNFALMRQAHETSHALLNKVNQEQAKAEDQAKADGGEGADAGKGADAAGAAGAKPKSSKPLKRNQLGKQYLRYMQKQHGVPSLWWYTGNAFVQVNVFMSMSAALRRMSAAMWTGFDTEGLSWFADMTKPAVEWGTWATGYGVAGAILPLAVFGVYVYSLGFTSLAERPLFRSSVEAACLPMFLAAMVVPHATVLYWLTNGAFNLGLQATLSRPAAAAALGMPMAAVYARGDAAVAVKAELERRQVIGAVGASDDPGFVSYLASDTMARGQHAAALACLRRLTKLRPEDAAAWRQMADGAGRMGQWAAAGDAHERAAGLLLAAAGGRAGQPGAAAGGGGGGSGGSGGAAAVAAAGAEYVAGAVAYLNAASIPTAAAEAAAAPASRATSAERLTHVGQALELLYKAEVQAGVSDASSQYLTCMARLATGQLPAALDAAQRSWELARQGEGGGGAAAEAEAAARLALPVAALCDKLAAQPGAGGAGKLLRAGELAAEVAAAAGGAGRASLGAALRRAADAAGVRESAAGPRLSELAASVPADGV